MIYKIYLRRNKVNGKCYVGQTSNFRQREHQWKCLKWRYGNEYLDKDRISYGLDAWTVEILAECDTQDEAWKLEQKYIKELNTLYPNGYNLAEGGASSTGFKLSEETKRKMSEIRKGILLNREDLSKLVYQYTLEGELVEIWASTRECGRNGYNSSKVAACCRGEQQKHKGYKWSYK